MENIKNLLKELTLEEKAGLCSGKDAWLTKAVERLGIPSARMSDGPHGLRTEIGGKTLEAVCFPTASMTAASFDRSLMHEIGTELGRESQEKGVNILLGPGINMKRSPLCGRNFEYFSEDPCLAGELGAEFVSGVQSQGVGTSLKHFFANSQEHRRMDSSSEMDERTAREIYLAAFETVVKKAQPWTIMASYNKISGTYSTANKKYIDEILRKEWGFVGVTLTDAVMANRNWMDVSIGLEAGNDTWLSSGDWLVSKIEGWAAEDGKLLNNLRTSAKNFLYTYANSAAMNGMNETSHVVHTTSWVETDMLIARIVLIVLTALFGLAMLVSYFMDVKKKAASADRKTVSIVAAVIAVLAAIFYIIIDTAATTKMNFDAVVLVLLLVSAVCYLVAGVKKIGLLAAAGLACTLVAWFRYLVTEINFRMDDLVLIFGGTSTIGALGVPFILSFILMLLAAISGAVLMTGAMGSEKK